MSIIIASLIEDIFCNQLILGDIHAPMNEISDVYKIMDGDTIIGGWTVFHGFDIPTIVFPPLLPEAWQSIKQLVTLFKLPAIQIPHPRSCTTENQERPWENWPRYTFTKTHTDIAMRLKSKDFEVMDIDHLPTIRAATNKDIDELQQFYADRGEEFEGFFHPLQLRSDNYAVCEDNGKIVGVAGTHFETSYTLQLGNIFVDPKYRGKGIGRALTLAVVLGAIKTGRVPTLFVNKNNERAIELYESIGFEKYDEYEFYTGYQT